MRHLSLALLLLVAACASRPPYASGYLGDYSGLKPSPRYAETWAWQLPAADLADYDRVMIEPILVQLIKKSPGNDLDATAVRNLAQNFREGLVASIEPYYEVAKSGGSHTMRVQVVLTDVTPATPDRSGGLAIEVEALDAVTGTRLAAAVSRLEWPYDVAAPGLDPKRLESVYAEWGRRFVAFLDRQKQVNG